MVWIVDVVCGDFTETAQRWVLLKVLHDPKHTFTGSCFQKLTAKAAGLHLVHCGWAVDWVSGSGLMGMPGQAASQTATHSWDHLPIATVAGKIRNHLAEEQSPEASVPSLSQQRKPKAAPSQPDIV